MAYTKERGFAAIVSLLAIMSMSVIFASGFLFVTLRGIEGMQANVNSAQGYYASEAGIEDAIYRLKHGKDIGAETVLAVGSAWATTTIASVGQTRTIIAEGSQATATRKVQVELELSSEEADFYYGVQIGAGGLEMKQNSVINGSIYSDGNIGCPSSCTGAKINGDAWIAGGGAAVENQSSTSQNANLSVGTTAGSVIASVDVSGDVGAYDSLALGSDGFARISYYDGSNGDLKFVRCLDADCSTKNITSVDTGGDVGWRYTSLALGSDGFARISYYDNTNGDLKFVQCTNADCSTKNITSVDTTNNIGQFSSLALGSDGFARITYYSISAGDLKFVQCTNADCSTKNITSVDTSGDVGKYTSLALGSDGFARIAYINETNDDLKFVQCTNADCSTKNITSVDTASSLNYNTSLALGADGFARISYYDDAGSNRDLKFVQCTNADCSTKNITSVDTSGDVGKYSSVKMGSDGFARISYYDGSNGSVKLARCTNADCSSNVVSTVDTVNDTGHYTSLALGVDAFPRISYYNNTNGDLKFVRCSDADCAPGGVQSDAAQSFRPSATSPISKVSLYIKKVGDPSNATVRIVSDNGGVPGGAINQLTSGTLNAVSVGANYAWIDVGFSSNPTLTSGTTYWIVLDAGNDAANYWVWGYSSTGPYGNGQAKYSPDWSAGSPTWTNVGGSANSDLAFKVFVVAGATGIDGLLVTGDVHANTITNSQVCGDAYYTSIDASSLTFLNSPGSPCPLPYTPGTAYSGSADPPSVPMAISQANIDAWHTAAEAGGTIAGPYSPPNGTTIGPVKINGDLDLSTNGAIYYIGGPVWVVGDIILNNNTKIILVPGFGDMSTVVVADDPANQSTRGMINVDNGVKICGSAGYNAGTNQCNPSNGSYIMFLSTYNGMDDAIKLKNNSDGAIFYTSAGSIEIENTASAKQITGYKVQLENNAVVTYESGLQDVKFSSGPAAGWKIRNWKEVQ